MRIFAFELAGRNLALPAEVVAQVYEAGPATPLPFVPGYVDGLALVSGRILPQVDLACRLGLGPGSGEELLAMRTTRGEMILRVDCVNFIDRVEDGAIAAMGDDTPHAEEFYHGQFDVRGQSHLLLRPEALAIEGASPDGDPMAAPAIGLLGEREEVAAIRRAADLACLVVRVGEDTFAFPLGDVSEVFRDRALTPVAGAPATVAGISVSRRIPRLVLPLGRTLGLDVPPGIAMVEVQTRAGRLLFACDDFVGIRRFPAERFERAEQRALSGYLFNPDGKVTPLVDVDGLVDADTAQSLAPFVPRLSPAMAAADADAAESVKLLLFQAAGELCGLAARSLVRVARHRTVTPVPAGDEHIAGVVDIGGVIMPVVDLRTHLDGTPEGSTTEGGTLVVAQTAGQQHWALLVEKVDRLADIPAATLRQAEGASPLVGAIGRLGDRLVTILDVEALRQHQPLAALPDTDGSNA